MEMTIMDGVESSAVNTDHRKITRCPCATLVAINTQCEVEQGCQNAECKEAEEER